MVLLHLLMQKYVNRKQETGTSELQGRKLKVESTLELDNFETFDSMNRYRFIVAHFDHGIREDSHLDRRLVQEAALRYGIPFVYDRAQLGSDASEQTARQARYDFLRRVQKVSQARAVITAHHQDDWLETAIYNLMRGTNRKGLTSLASSEFLERPLLDTPKKQLIDYAKQHNIAWREDSTNEDTRFARNNIRHNVLPKLGPAGKARLLTILKDMRSINQQIDEQVEDLLRQILLPSGLKRGDFIMLPHVIAREVAAAWLRQNNIRDFGQPFLERMVRAVKVLPAGKVFDVNARWQIKLTHNKATFIPRSH